MKINACASSANLGPGFDCFGIAWQRYDTIEFLPSDDLEIAGCDEEFRGRDNLAYRAYAEVAEKSGVSPMPLKISFKGTDIPVSRGLGSSAALISAGALAANGLHGLGLSRRELLELATPIEGHPDNLAPALLGGMTVSAMDGEKVISEHIGISDKLHFAALVPDAKLSTALARSVLPRELSRADAIFNVSHAALVIRAFESGDIDLLRFALQDKIHEPYRTKLIPHYAEAKALALDNGADAMCISGAGSTLLCVSSAPVLADKLRSAFASLLPAWEIFDLYPDLSGSESIA